MTRSCSSAGNVLVISFKKNHGSGHSDSLGGTLSQMHADAGGCALQTTDDDLIYTKTASPHHCWAQSHHPMSPHPQWRRPRRHGPRKLHQEKSSSRPMPSQRGQCPTQVAKARIAVPLLVYCVYLGSFLDK
ncbi:hypothetical protein C8R44DRAFT_815810 [Mycena epipterygia]|nr:hypothetical protein C8R44DRAFT_815810 [Mycena epipterygia]